MLLTPDYPDSIDSGVDLIRAEDGGIPLAVADHIVTWDPARVLAEIAAKRRILGRHRDYDFPPDPDDGPGDYAWTPRCDTCFETWPCPTLLDLAAPYAGHPDYDPAWKAEADDE